jgi:hypothetical protein
LEEELDKDAVCVRLFFKLYGEYLIKEALEGVGDIQTVQVIGTVK